MISNNYFGSSAGCLSYRMYLPFPSLLPRYLYSHPLVHYQSTTSDRLTNWHVLLLVNEPLADWQQDGLRKHIYLWRVWPRTVRVKHVVASGYMAVVKCCVSKTFSTLRKKIRCANCNEQTECFIFHSYLISPSLNWHYFGPQPNHPSYKFLKLSKCIVNSDFLINKIIGRMVGKFLRFLATLN